MPAPAFFRGGEEASTFSSREADAFPAVVAADAAAPDAAVLIKSSGRPLVVFGNAPEPAPATAERALSGDVEPVAGLTGSALAASAFTASPFEAAAEAGPWTVAVLPTGADVGVGWPDEAAVAAEGGFDGPPDDVIGASEALLPIGLDAVPGVVTLPLEVPPAEVAPAAGPDFDDDWPGGVPAT